MTTALSPAAVAPHARRLELAGRVQGVGFRPFVYRLARRYGLAGWVRNEVGRVLVHVEGPLASLEMFRAALLEEAPVLARPEIVADAAAALSHDTDFVVLPSRSVGPADIVVPPDLFTCDACLAELEDRSDRRFGYAFINCTHCGPRYTLIEAMPYDRANTSMAAFELCDACRAEYTDPRDRRFHAEPIACPDCGPELSFDRAGEGRAHGTAALVAATAAVVAGEIVAVKGIGGYHLVCDARDEAAIERLRARKDRPTKPLAVMFPLAGADGLDRVRDAVELGSAAAAAVRSAARPIVLAPRRAGAPLSRQIAPGLGEVGVFLPYSPLHHVLLRRLDRPLVATSGNIGGEPVLTENVVAERRLAGIADAFLHHDRAIVRSADDSVYRVIAGRVRPLRIGRGAAPLEIELPQPQPYPVVGLGGQMKATVCLSWSDRAVMSPHIGDLGTPRGLAVLERVVADLQSLYGVRAQAFICDAHRDYSTARWASRCALPCVRVWHHHAHASALAGEHRIEQPLIVFAWDGVGLGPDGTLWGGETLLGTPGDWQRRASMRPFRLPGGERAAREPWRSAAAVCWDLGRELPAPSGSMQLVRRAWEQRVNAPVTTATGRLFDAAAAIIMGIVNASYEGEAPMRLESLAAAGTGRCVELPLEPGAEACWRVDWRPLFEHLLDSTSAAEERAATLHRSLAGTIVAQAELLRDRYRVDAVGLSGGVFQNALLTELAVDGLMQRGFEVVLSERVPNNDAGLSFGQVVEHAATVSR